MKFVKTKHWSLQRWDVVDANAFTINYGLNFRSSCCWTDDANCLSQLHCCQHHNDLIFDLCVKDHWSAWQWMNIEITSGKKLFLFYFFLNWDACIMYMCIKLLTCICSCILVRRYTYGNNRYSFKRSIWSTYTLFWTNINVHIQILW